MKTRTGDLRIVIIGAGMAGILSAIELREAGLTDLTVYEKNEGLGGTWRENTYPGVACDVPAHLYSFSFEPNPGWSHVFAPGREILHYLESVADRHGVEEHVRYGTEVRRMTFRDGRWHIETSDGGHDTADVVIAATGVLHHPSYPDIDGLGDFDGTTFHTSRWDHDVPLDGRRVGIVGTGSSGVQVTAAIVDRVEELHLFQRTPQWVLPVENPPIDPEDRERFRAEPASMRELRDHLQRVFEESFANAVVDADSEGMARIEALCRAHLEGSVRDAELRERLRPDYRPGCKRLVVSSGFYEAVQRPNAEVVTAGIERVEPEGVRTTDGRLHPLDVLVLATGFRVDRFLRPIEVLGRDGVSLDDAWSETPVAYLSISVPGFPNLFMLNGPNGPVGNFSLIDVAELQIDYILQLLDLLRTGRCREVSARRDATDRFEADRVEATRSTVWVTGCRSWYLDDRGVPAVWPWRFDRFREEMSRPRLADYELVDERGVRRAPEELETGASA